MKTYKEFLDEIKKQEDCQCKNRDHVIEIPPNDPIYKHVEAEFYKNCCDCRCKK